MFLIFRSVLNVKTLLGYTKSKQSTQKIIYCCKGSSSCSWYFVQF